MVKKHRIRAIFSSTGLFALMGLYSYGSIALASDAAPAYQSLCPYYAGSTSLEIKAGSERSLGNMSAFVPIACTADSLLFTDLRFKQDEFHNQEGNAGFGARFLTDWNGIIGAYVFYDRKRTNASDKFHTQATFGAEWLAEHWESRANYYTPITSTKHANTGLPPGLALSDPYLAGTGIFVTESALQVLHEKPMSGADFELGLRAPYIPDLWAHAGVYRFSAGEGSTLSGTRGRLTYDFTPNLALIAEGQWDDERGSQGWLGARLSFAFGGGDEHPTGLKTRMTTLPVRDVDIVTSQSVTGEPTQETPVINTESGATQRVLYVNNTAAAGGDGSLDRPFNTLADAQAALQDHDIVYLYRGDGTTAGQNVGLTIARTGVQLIGAGSAFTYDGSKFSAASGDFTGTTLIAAGTAPLITNINAGGNGVTVTGDNAFLSGFTAQGALQDGINILNASATLTNVTAQNNGRYGIYAFADTAETARSFSADYVTASSNTSHGLFVNASGAGATFSTISINAASVLNNSSNGLRVVASSGGAIGIATLQNVTSSGNTANGVLLYSTDADSQITSATIDTLLTQGNGGPGLRVASSSEGQMSTVYLNDISAINGSYLGVQIYASDVGSSINNLSINNLLTQNNASTGLYLESRWGGQINTTSLLDVTASGNTGRGIHVSAGDTASAFNSILIDRVLSRNNTTYGLYIDGITDGVLTSATVQNSTFTANTLNGVYINDDTTGTFGIDLGGGALGSTGNNRIYDNTGTDINVDLDGGTLSAQYNWWGTAAGLQVGETTLDGATTIDASNFLTVDPAP